MNLRTLLNPNAIPRDLWPYRQYVVWKYVDRGKVKLDKVPVNALNLANAGSTWPSTWTDIRTVVATYQAHEEMAGIGFVLTEHDPVVGIDIDNCLTNAAPSPLACELLDRLATYAEVSPSGTGLRMIVRCRQLPVVVKRKEIEIYPSDRWLTLTGNRFNNHPIADFDNLDWLTKKYKDVAEPTARPTAFLSREHAPPPADDVDLWRRICRVNPLANALYAGDVAQAQGDQSRAVILLLNSLAKWTDGDPARMRRMLEQTALDQTKWSERRGQQTWLDGRINDAIEYMAVRGSR